MKTTQDVGNCEDEDHWQYHLGIDHCHTGNHCQDREHYQNGNEHADLMINVMLTILAHEYISYPEIV